MDTFSEYQEATRKTAIYPEAGTGSALALAYTGLGLGEVGEIQNNLKKVIRDEDGIISEARRDSIVGEIGDCLWYLARLSDELGIDLGQVAKLNVDKLNSRKERGVIKGSGDNR